MSGGEILLLGVAGWTAIGIAGLSISGMRAERKKAATGAAWIAGVWLAYLALVVGTSKLQSQRVVAMGQDQCFDEMCFAVLKAEEIAGFSAPNQRKEHASSEGQGRMVRVVVRVSNRGRSGAESEELISAYLVDEDGRRWEQLRALSGVKLTARVSARGTVTSEPVFRVPPDAHNLRLAFTHGRWYPSRLVVGDAESVFHRPTVVPLGL